MNSRKTPCIGITLPRELITLVDRRATQIRQPRSRFVATILWQAVKDRPLSTVEVLQRLNEIDRKLSLLLAGAGLGGTADDEGPR